MDRQIDEQIDRTIEGEKDRRIEGQRDRMIEGQKDRRIEGYNDRRIEGQKDRMIEGQRILTQKFNQFLCLTMKFIKLVKEQKLNVSFIKDFQKYMIVSILFEYQMNIPLQLLFPFPILPSSIQFKLETLLYSRIFKVLYRSNQHS